MLTFSESIIGCFPFGAVFLDTIGVIKSCNNIYANHFRQISEEIIDKSILSLLQNHITENNISLGVYFKTKLKQKMIEFK